MIFISGGEKLVFEEKGHLYSFEGRSLESVNSVLKRYSHEFDKDGTIIARKAVENGITVTEQRKLWDKTAEDSRNRGTYLHNDVETYVKTKKIPKTDNESLVKQFVNLKLKGALYSEVRLHNLNYEIAGTTDIIQLFTDNSICLFDLKTNQAKKMTRFSYGRKMLYPLGHIWDSTLDKYELQLSLYAYMLEEAGWWVKDVKIIHVDYDKLTLKEIEMQYRRRDVVRMLEHYRKNYNKG